MWVISDCSYHKNPPEHSSHELAQQSSTKTGNVDKGTLRKKVWCHYPLKLETIPITCSFGKGRKGERGLLYLLAQRHPAAESAGQTDDFGYKCFKSQVLLQDHPPEDSLHFWNTRTWVGMMERKEKVSWRKAITERESGREWDKEGGEGNKMNTRGGQMKGEADWNWYAHHVGCILWISSGCDYVVHMKSPWRPCDEFQSQLHSSNTELTINYGCACVWMLA